MLVVVFVARCLLTAPDCVVCVVFLKLIFSNSRLFSYDGIFNSELIVTSKNINYIIIIMIHDDTNYYVRK